VRDRFQSRVVQRQLSQLADGLDATVPAKHLDRNLLIATWNIRALGGLTERWETTKDDSPKRNLADARAIAQVLSRFDVVAVQEVRGDLKALRHVLKALGPEWGFILTDVTQGDAGNNERLAFVFDLRRVKPSGLACELTVPDEWLGRIGQGALREQFARTPYAVSFQSGSQTFILVTLHVVYGEAPEDRLGELAAIAEWLRDWARRSEDFNHNLIALGDFNIDREGDPNFDAFTSTGLRAPPELDAAPRTISDPDGGGAFYDQLAWFHEDSHARLTLQYTGQAGHFPWTDHYLQDVPNQQRSWRMNDHYPLWAKFSVRGH
jgi:endonuclease/exonuclease/phosphatase family metal-dependent hydrolase